ncbi:hypothetical protein [Natrinema versiforme]|nr:hypothetical protein [Natrinema versiforme]
MPQPYGRCQHCGERLYAHIEGGYQCLNCGRRYTEADLETRAT